MGLLFGDTYVVNKTTSGPSNEGLTRATRELAEATRKVATSTQNIANAINDDRVTISHKRYAELLNKRKALQSVKQEITIRLNALCSVINSSDYKERYMNTYVMDGPYKKIEIFKGGIKEGLCVGMNYKEKTAYLYQFSEDKKINYSDYKTVEDLGYDIIPFKNPVYVVETDGSAEISGKEYNSLLNDETLFDNIYLPAVDVLPKVMFELLNVDRLVCDTKNNQRFIQFVSYINNNRYSSMDRFFCNSNGYIWDFQWGKTITIKHSY